MWIVTSQSPSQWDRILPDELVYLTCNRQRNISLSLKSDFYLLFNTYDVDVYFDGSKLGTISNGDTFSIDLKVTEGDHTLKVKRSDATDPSTIQSITVSYDTEFNCTIAHGIDTITLNNVNIKSKEEQIGTQLAIPDESAQSDTTTMTLPEDGQSHEDSYISSTNSLDTTEMNDQITEEQPIEYPVPPSVPERPIETDEGSGPVHEEVPPQETIVTGPPMESTDPPVVSKKITAPYHSSGDKDTAREGNTGVYSYVKSGNYSIYYIIDFDEGYVYRFIDGNGDESCDRVKIDFGSMNEYVQITYHDGDYVWSEAVSFKFRNNPDKMVHQDSYGDTTDFKSTDLSKALQIRDTKKIIDY